MKLIYIIITISIALLLLGCPYESKIKVPSKYVVEDPMITGKWTMQDTTDNELVKISISSKNKRYKLILLKSGEINEVKMYGYIAYMDSTKLICLSENNEDYSFYKYSINNDSCCFRHIKESAVNEEINNQSELIKMLKENINKDSSLGDPLCMIRSN